MAYDYQKLAMAFLGENPTSKDAEIATMLKDSGCPGAQIPGIIEAVRVPPKPKPAEPPMVEAEVVAPVQPPVQQPTPQPEPAPQPQPPQSRALMPQPSERAADQMRLDASASFINPVTWQYMELMANKFIVSKALPKGIENTGQLIMILQAGMERGMKPMESISSFYIVNGKVTLYGEMAIAKVIEAGHSVEWGECNDETATVTITRGDTGKSMTASFTMKEAIAKGLTVTRYGEKKEPWAKFPGNMLRFKAFSLCAKFHVPDALRNTPIKEDLEGGFEEADMSPHGIIHVDRKVPIVPSEARRPSLDEAVDAPPTKPAKVVKKKAKQQ